MDECRFRLAGLEAVVRVSDRALLAHAAGPWQSYRSHGGIPDVLVEIELDGGSPAAWPPGRTAAFDVERLSATTVLFRRPDCTGEVSDGTNGPITARFHGRAAPVVIEAAVRIAFASALPRVNGLLLHASGLSTGDRGILFLGPSGAGKSTIERLARAGSTALASLGDELTIARRVGTRWTAFATPFAGENGPASYAEAPLGALVFLEKAAHHRPHPLPRTIALRRLLRNVVTFVTDQPSAARTLAVGAELIATVPAHLLEFARQTDIADVIERL